MFGYLVPPALFDLFKLTAGVIPGLWAKAFVSFLVGLWLLGLGWLFRWIWLRVDAALSLRARRAGREPPEIFYRAEFPVAHLPLIFGILALLPILADLIVPISNITFWRDAEQIQAIGDFGRMVSGLMWSRN